MKVKESFELMNGLASIVRYSQSTLCRPESVLEHTGQVACLCLIIGKNLTSLGAEIDMGLLLEKALVHDMDETVTGDVARPTKYYSDEIKRELDNLSRESIAQIGKNINCNMWEWVVAKDGIEGSIVAIVDGLAVLCKAHDEIVMRGNKRIIFGGAKGLIERLSANVDFLVHSVGCEKYFRELEDGCRELKHEIEKELKCK